MLDEAELRHLYLEEQRSIRTIATLLHVSTGAIYRALIHYDIPRRSGRFRATPGQPVKARFDAAELRRLYLEKQRSIRDIAALHEVSTRRVYEALIHYNIPRRSAAQKRPTPSAMTFGASVLDKATLQRLYQENGQSIVAIATTLGASPTRIRNALVRWGIPRRRRGRSNHTAPEQAQGASLDR